MGDISTDLLSPGADAHSRSDRELHGKSMFEHDADKQQALLDLQAQHPDKRVMLVAEKGTMGVGSSRMSGVNNVALWIGKQASPYVPFINFAPVVAGTNGISPIFLTTVGVTGGIGLDLKNWVTQFDDAGELIFSAFGQYAQSGGFTIPATALNGLTRLRVAMSFAVPPACGGFAEGEVEDYCVTITGGVTPTCDASAPVSASMRRTPALEALSPMVTNRPISPVWRTWVPPHNSRE